MAAALPYFLVIGDFGMTPLRYFMPLVPVLAILAARAVLETPSRKTVGIVVALVVVLHTAVFTATLVPRLGYEQQSAVVEWLRTHLPRAPSGSPPRVEMPDTFAAYSQLPMFLGRAHIKPEFTAFGRWLEEAPDAFLLPEWLAILIRRLPLSAHAVEQLDALESGALGYREAARWPPSWFLHEGLYARIDPALRTVWHGREGVRVYVPSVPRPR
jgi:hypothetical protein